eukprot:scaffold39154_cov161-Skeletonema_dohrnii-CCMP3373.AAC.2
MARNEVGVTQREGRAKMARRLVVSAGSQKCLIWPDRNWEYNTGSNSIGHDDPSEGPQEV